MELSDFFDSLKLFSFIFHRLMPAICLPDYWLPTLSAAFSLCRDTT